MSDEKCACAIDAIILLDRLDIIEKELLKKHTEHKIDEPYVPIEKIDFNYLRVAAKSVQFRCGTNVKDVTDKIDVAEMQWDRGKWFDAYKNIYDAKVETKREILECSNR